jgi:cell pole-organizing protein PopZ
MTQAAKAQEPSMEEILASIRRIIADDDAGKPAGAPEPATGSKQTAAAAPARPAPSPAASTRSTTSSASPPAAPPKPAAPPAAAANSQDDIDAMLAELDAPPKATPKPAQVGNAPAQAAGEILDLTEAMTTPPPGPAPSFRTIDGNSDVVFSSKPPPQPQSHAQAQTHAQTHVQTDRGLISNETIAAVDSAFNSLAHTIIGQNARTLEDLVREMLRPMLKSWLDDNLPGLVERIVRAEIERVSRGRP